MEVSGQFHALADLPPGVRAPDTHRIGGWVGPRAGLDVVSKRKRPCPYRKSNPVRPTPSLVTTLTYPRFYLSKINFNIILKIRPVSHAAFSIWISQPRHLLVPRAYSAYTFF